jgi:cytochrome c-type biogenesis protein CcmH
VRRWLGWVAIVWLLLVGSVAVVAYGRPTTHASLDERTIAVASTLRCLVCQGESIAESPSGFARSVRADIRRRRQEGQTSAQIQSFLVGRYTDSILLEPPHSGLGNLAWIAPPLLLIGGLGLLATLVYDWRRRGRDGEPQGRRAAYLERVRAELSMGTDGE